MRRIAVACVMPATIIVLTAALLLPGCGTSGKTNRMMVGRWVSPEREYTTNLDESVYYITRDYTFTNDAFRAVTTVYGDPVSGIKFYTATVDGTYTLVGESNTVAGATDIDFTIVRITMKPDSPAFVDIFMRSGCGDGIWGLDVPQDVSDTGCLSLASIEACPVEYNIVKIQGDFLQMGLRPADGNICSPENRPIELSAKVLARPVEE
jgi:hypothetical protein